jgi:hypothetical protein
MKIKNTQEQVDTWTGQQIEPSEYYTIAPSELPKWQNDSKVLSDIASGKLLLNNEIEDIADVAVAINTLKGIDASPTDDDGSKIIRSKAANAGWKAQFHSVRVSTATSNGVRSKKRDGTDTGFCTYTMYDINGNVTALPLLCAKTVVTWEPNHDMEIVGGQLLQAVPPISDVWMYVTAAAHIPAQYGGSIAFTEGGINLSDVGVGGNVNFDGRVSKYIAYDATYHSGRFYIELQHPANFQHNFTLVFELFKP